MFSSECCVCVFVCVYMRMMVVPFMKYRARCARARAVAGAQRCKQGSRERLIRVIIIQWQHCN